MKVDYVTTVNPPFSPSGIIRCNDIDLSFPENVVSADSFPDGCIFSTGRLKCDLFRTFPESWKRHNKKAQVCIIVPNDNGFYKNVKDNVYSKTMIDRDYSHLEFEVRYPNLANVKYYDALSFINRDKEDLSLDMMKNIVNSNNYETKNEFLILSKCAINNFNILNYIKLLYFITSKRALYLDNMLETIPEFYPIWSIRSLNRNRQPYYVHNNILNSLGIETNEKDKELYNYICGL